MRDNLVICSFRDDSTEFYNDMVVRYAFQFFYSWFFSWTALGFGLVFILVGCVFFYYYCKSKKKAEQSSIVEEKAVRPEEDNREPNTIVRVGQLVVDVSTEPIGRGSGGTVVFVGNHGGREVAVKRIVKSLIKGKDEIAEKENKVYLESDNHENILRLHGLEQTCDFFYLCVELCDQSLFDLFNNYSSNHCGFAFDQQIVTPDMIKLISEIVDGLSHLHEKGFIHRDLKPNNILLKGKTVKIADMGSVRDMGLKTSVSTYTGGCGTLGWRPPEFMSMEPLSFGSDSFNLGCTIFFCLTMGHHPFGGDAATQESNIHDNIFNLARVSHFPEGEDLVLKLINRDPKKRPLPKEVRSSPLFWDWNKRLSFLCLVSEKLNRGSDPYNMLEQNARRVIKSKGWKLELDQSFRVHLYPERVSYNAHEVYSLIRCVRNKASHFTELSEDVKVDVGRTLQDFESYFRSKFPNLLMVAYNVAKQFWQTEPEFSEYLTWN